MIEWNELKVIRSTSKAVNGLIDLITWRALFNLHFNPAEPTWSPNPPPRRGEGARWK